MKGCDSDREWDSDRYAGWGAAGNSLRGTKCKSGRQAGRRHRAIRLAPQRAIIGHTHVPVYICGLAGWLTSWLSTCALISGPRPYPGRPPVTHLRRSPSSTEFHSRSVCFCPRSICPSGFFSTAPPLRTCSSALHCFGSVCRRLLPLPLPRPRRTRLQPSKLISIPCPSGRPLIAVQVSHITRTSAGERLIRSAGALAKATNFLDQHPPQTTNMDIIQKSIFNSGPHSRGIYEPPLGYFTPYNTPPYIAAYSDSGSWLADHHQHHQQQHQQHQQQMQHIRFPTPPITPPRPIAGYGYRQRTQSVIMKARGQQDELCRSPVEFPDDSKSCSSSSECGTASDFVCNWTDCDR